MRIIISSGSYFRPVIIQKDPMSVTWNLRIRGWIILSHNFCYIITRLEVAEWTGNYQSMFSDVVQSCTTWSIFSNTKIMIFIQKVLLMTFWITWSIFSNRKIMIFFKKVLLMTFWILYTNVLYLVVLNIKFRAMLSL